MNYDCRTMGERISHRRQALHIKQNILAEKLNISNNCLLYTSPSPRDCS